MAPWLIKSLKRPGNWLVILSNVPMVVFAFTSGRFVANTIAAMWWEMAILAVVIVAKMSMISAVTPPRKGGPQMDASRFTARDFNGLGAIIIFCFPAAAFLFFSFPIASAACAVGQWGWHGAPEGTPRSDAAMFGLMVTPEALESAASLAFGRVIEFFTGFVREKQYRKLAGGNVCFSFFVLAMGSCSFALGGGVFLLLVPGVFVVLVIISKLVFNLYMSERETTAANTPAEPEPAAKP